MKSRAAIFLMYLIIWISSCIFSFPSLAQSSPSKKVLKQHLLHADYYWQHELYAEAAKYYGIASRIAPDDSYITYHLAQCHRHLFDYKSAEKEYGQVYYSAAQKYPEALFYYALMQKFNKKYVEAIKNFDSFIENAVVNEAFDPVTKSKLIDRAKLEKAGCAFAFAQLLLPWREFNFSQLPKPVVSDFHDYAPIIVENDSALIITSGRENTTGKIKDIKLGEYLSDMYRFHVDSTGWNKTINNDQFEAINTPWGDGTGTFNASKDKFYFTSCYEENSSCKIYLTTLQNGVWTKPVKLNTQVNLTGFDSRQPALSPSGDTLYFVSNRPGGFGLNDIWMSVSRRNENWSQPVNVGSKINTPQQELSPYYNAVENKLFFASDGHIGLGGLDIFMADGPDKEVINMGFPINSDKDDFFFIMGTTTGYLSSNRSGTYGNFDIYSFKIKSSETVLALINRNLLEKKIDLSYLASFNLDYLPEEDKLAVDRIVSRKEAGRLYKKDLPLDKEDAFFYAHLSTEEKQKIERMVDQRINQLTESDLSVLRGQDEFYYQNLATEDKERINRMTKAFLQAKISNQDIVLTDEDAFYYQKLSYEDKQRLNRVIASRIHEETDPLVDPTSLSTEDRFYYEKLPAAEKERINRMIAAKKALQESGEDIALNEEDSFYYTHLSEEEKKIVNRIISTQLTNAIASSDVSSLREQEQFQYQQLPVNEKNQISSQRSRFKNGEKINAQDASLNNFSMGDYNNVSISGKLMETATRSPAAGIMIPLVNEKGSIIKMIRTGEDGSFKYTNLPLDENYKILIETPSSNIAEPSKYYVEDLQVIGYEEAPISINLKNIYFDFNKYALRKESIDILEKLADFYHRFPDIQIEIHAYTDSIGSDAYNLVLSRQRGEAVLNYLLQKELPSHVLVVNARGKSNPATSNEDSTGRQNNRRVEFLIKGGPLLYNQDLKTYILPARTSLESIARETGMTVKELQELNNLTSDFIEPYQPIKVRISKKSETSGFTKNKKSSPEK
ncbi:OmpA family protein [Rhodocytophaga rosea]|uniref:OmpA family protein n=1 Tax=Rhodocytophaga rosea TaxID=2704465 RepID=A0A6C0GF15_9BACT|nr:OmpA family protein [Rhodocytophaga rosea]QHT66260.1 OmpA family protein [Rhodocytophaga rosea]